MTASDSGGIPRHAFQARMKKTQDWISGVDALALHSLQNIYWLTGTAQFATLIVPRPELGEPVLFVRRNIERAKQECTTCEVRPLVKTTDWADYLKTLFGSFNGRGVGIELSMLPTTYYLRYEKMLAGAKIAEVGEQFRRLRMVKDSYEIARHTDAGQIVSKTQAAAREACKPGVTESEVAGEMVKVARANGAEHYSNYYSRSFFFNWFIVASGQPGDGQNLWVPSTFPIMSGAGTDPAIPYGPGTRVLRSGDMVVADYAVIYKGYHADHCRSYLVDGIPDGYKQRYESLMHAYLCGIEVLRAGSTAEAVFNAMKQELKIDGLDKNFCGDGTYYQSVGHGLGLELDEPPIFIQGDTTPLEENMVVSLEPKIIIPGWGAINFEDNFIIKKGAPVKLTPTPYLEF